LQTSDSSALAGVTAAAAAAAAAAGEVMVVVLVKNCSLLSLPFCVLVPLHHLTHYSYSLSTPTHTDGTVNDVELLHVCAECDIYMSHVFIQKSTSQVTVDLLSFKIYPLPTP
jgi:hypothetical protein